MMRCLPRPRRGFLLVEMLIAIGMIGIFIIVSGKLFSTTLRLTHASQAATAGAATFESSARALRRDVWGAAEITVLPGGGVIIRQGDGASISWRAEDDGALVRRDEAAHPSVQRWPEMGTKVTLQPDRAGLVVRTGEGEMLLVSQVLLSHGSKP